MPSNTTCDAVAASYTSRLGIFSVITKWPNGYEEAWFDSEAQASCAYSYINIPGINLLPYGFRAFLYFVALIYSFLGISIVADIFMSAVEQICSQEKIVKLKDGTTITAQVWNPTVANLTLMALGSSAPEILLAVIEGWLTLGAAPGELGPSTIVGSAAFNLLMISAACIVALPGESVKSISDIKVFCVTATWSVLVYVWMFVVLDVWTPGVVTMEEAWITLGSMVIFVGMAYCQDRKWFMAPRKVDRGDGDSLSAQEEGDRDQSGRVIGIDIEKDGEHRTQKDRDAIRRIMKGLKKPAVEASVKLKSVFSAVAATMSGDSVRKYKGSSIFWKINARHKMAGKKHIVTQEEAERNAERREQASRSELGSGQLPSFGGAEDEGLHYLERSVKSGGSGSRTASMRNRTTSKRGSMSGRPERQVVPEHLESKVGFTSHDFRVMEHAGKVKLAVRRYGVPDALSVPSCVDYESCDGTAVGGADYDAVKGTITFEAGEIIKHIEVPIHDNDHPNQDKTFNVTLQNHTEKPDPSGLPTLGTMGRVSFRLGALSLAQVVIIDDDDPGMFNFAHTAFAVLETEGSARVKVLRSTGASGTVTVDYHTSNGSAVSGTHYEESCGTLTFAPGETEKFIDIPIIDNDISENDTVFHVMLSNPTNLSSIGRQNVLLVHIKDDEGLDELASDLRTMLHRHSEAFHHATSSWREQILEALEPQPGVDDHGEEQDLGFSDYFFHYIAIFWKLLFALVPPTAYLHGWVTFVVSLICTGMLTAVVSELASLFGCAIGLKDSVTAITFVALGTSLPDLFASKNAAQEADDADAAIGNVTGSNTVNVLLGLGLPWVIGTLYYRMNPDLGTGGKYCVPSGTLSYSVMVFSVCAVLAIALLFLRRSTVGGELGGAGAAKWGSSIFLAGLWMIYILMSAFQSYGYIEFGTLYELDSFGCRVAPVST